MAIVLATDEYERIHSAALLASVAAMSGIPVQVYVTMEAVRFFRKDSPKAWSMKDVGKKLVEKKALLAAELLQEAKLLGDLKVYACAMVLDLFEWKEQELIDVFDGAIGIAQFLNDTEGSQIIFV